MSARELTRRGLFTGRWRESSPESVRPAPPARPLPRVIAWLADEGGPAPAVPAPARPAGLLRPPGALAEREFLERCTRCGECERACPHGAVLRVSQGRGALGGTPWIDPVRQPCLLCEGWPCVAACEPGALELSGAAAIGTAQLLPMDCLNRIGSPCSVCVERCPVPGAIELSGGLPAVNEGLCTGCGQCVYACPAPSKALVVQPREGRRTRSGSEVRA